jgi:hypothetical protein
MIPLVPHQPGPHAFCLPASSLGVPSRLLGSTEIQYGFLRLVIGAPGVSISASLLIDRTA